MQRSSVSILAALILCFVSSFSWAGGGSSYQIALKAYELSDYSLALGLLRQEANAGGKEAQFYLAEMYRKGHGTKRDLEKAASYYKQSAKQGYAPAQFNLARLYRSGKGIEKNEQTALEWYKKAANQRHGESQYKLGILYENGWGTDRDINAALEWYKRAADQNINQAVDKLEVLRNLSTTAKVSRYDTRVDLTEIEPYTALRLASFDGQMNSLKQILPKIKDINKPLDDIGNTALMIACEQNNYFIAEKLLRNNADIRRHNDLKQTALHFAAKNNSEKLLTLLLSKKLEINAQDKDGKTPLIEAITHKKVSSVKQLIAQGANVNLGDNFNRSPLIYAVSVNSLEIVDLLLKNQANINALDKSNYGALQHSVALDNKGIINLLLDNNADANFALKNGGNVFHFAIAQNKLDILPLLLQKKVDANKRDVQGWTPLMRAVAIKNLAILPQLIEATRSINEKNMYGESALIIAVNSNCLTCVELLMKAGANPTQLDRQGLNAISTAIKIGNRQIVDYFFSKKIQNYISPVDNGYTLLMYSVAHNWLDLAKIIFATGQENINHVANDGKSALSIAKTNNNRRIVSWLNARGAKILSKRETAEYKVKDKKDKSIDIFKGWGELHHAAWQDNLVKVNVFLDSGVDINLANQNKQTALMLAAQKSNCQLVSHLIERGANPALKDSRGLTALHFASKQGAVECIAHLYAKQSSLVNYKDKLGRTPLMLALKYNNHLASEKLISMGADLLLRDKNKISVMQYAINSRIPEIVETIIEFKPSIFIHMGDITGVYISAIKTKNTKLLKYLNRIGMQRHIRSSNYSQLIFTTIEEGSLSFLLELAENGIPLQISDENLNTPLHIAAINNQRHMIDFLVRKGLSIDAENVLRDTPLLIAIKSGYIELASDLISRGADPYLENKQGESVKSLAEARNQTRILKQL